MTIVTAPELSPRQQRRHEKTRSEVRTAARAVLERKGYSQVTLRDIVDEADISHPTFYKYFRSKEEVLGDLIEGVASELVATGGTFGLAAVDPETQQATSIRRRIRLGLEAMFAVVRANRRLLLSARQAITANEYHASRWNAFRSHALVVLRRDLDWGRERGIIRCEDIEMLSIAMIATAEAAIFEFAERDNLDPSAVEDVLESFYWNALFGWRGSPVDYVVMPDDILKPVFSEA